MWVFPKIGIPQNGWFIMEIPIKMDDSEVPLFFSNPHVMDFFKIVIPELTSNWFWVENIQKWCRSVAGKER